MFNRLDYTISQLNKNKTVLKQLNWLKKYIMEYPLSRIYIVDGYTTTDGYAWDEEIAGIEKSSVITFDDVSVKIGDIIIARQGMRMPLYMVTSTEAQRLFYNVTFIGYLQGKDGIEGMQGPRGATGPQGPQGPQGLNGKRGYGVFLSTVTNAHDTTDVLLTGDILEDHVRPIETGDIIIAINSPNSPVFYVSQVDRISESIDVSYYGNLRTFTVEDLEPLIEGSDTVDVDVNEEGTALEVHLDGSVTSKIDRALLQPLSAPTEDSVVVVTPQNEQTVVPVSQIGGGSKLYRHSIYIYEENNDNVDSYVTLYSTKAEPINTIEKITAILPQDGYLPCWGVALAVLSGEFFRTIAINKSDDNNIYFAGISFNNLEENLTLIFNPNDSIFNDWSMTFTDTVTEV